MNADEYCRRIKRMTLYENGLLVCRNRCEDKCKGKPFRLDFEPYRMYESVKRHYRTAHPFQWGILQQIDWKDWTSLFFRARRRFSLRPSRVTQL
jgi:hypothetical protein